MSEYSFNRSYESRLAAINRSLSALREARGAEIEKNDFVSDEGDESEVVEGRGLPGRSDVDEEGL